MKNYSLAKTICWAGWLTLLPATILAEPDRLAGQATACHTRVFVMPESNARAGDWLFYPDYRLPGRAGRIPLPGLPVLEPSARTVPVSPVPFRGLSPTSQISLVPEGSDLSTQAFSIELWLNDHVSEEIGLTIAAHPAGETPDHGWLLTYWSEGYDNRAMSFCLNGIDGGSPALLTYANTEKDGFKEYWRHLVGVYDGHEAIFYVNGQPKARKTPAGPLLHRDRVSMVATGYFDREPEMEIGHLVRRIRWHQRPLSQPEIQTRFKELCDEVERGLVFPGVFHFNAGPCLSGVTQTGAGIVWETDRPAECTLRWGIDQNLDRAAEPVPVPDCLIQKAFLTGLQSDTTYFYEVTARCQDGQTIRSGLLSFKTAAPAGQPFRFAIIGDTETRPFVNWRLSRLIWNERPSFLINLGDMTDGGKKPDKFQWNYEYFLGMMPLIARVAVFPVPGNGEGDLYWYKRYHALPGDESPYAFTWGDASFFMLDSNLAQPEFQPGGRQYRWLQDQLATCQSAWKMVCFHYAPYTSEEDDYGDSWTGSSTQGDPRIRPLLALLEQYRVDLVMFGHLHLYERTRPIRAGRIDPEGVVYLLCGGGGGNLEDFAPHPAWFTAKTHRGHHYCTIDLDPHRLSLRMHDLTGALRDQLDIDKHDRLIEEPTP